jgi:hypothetical protein
MISSATAPGERLSARGMASMSKASSEGPTSIKLRGAHAHHSGMATDHPPAVGMMSLISLAVLSAGILIAIVFSRF